MNQKRKCGDVTVVALSNALVCDVEGLVVEGYGDQFALFDALQVGQRAPSEYALRFAIASNHKRLTNKKLLSLFRYTV